MISSDQLTTSLKIYIIDLMNCIHLFFFPKQVVTFLISHAETNFDYDSSFRTLTVNVDFPFEFNYRRLDASAESNFKVHLDHCLSSSINASCHDIQVNQEISNIRTKRVCVNNTENFSSNKWIHCDLNQVLGQPLNKQIKIYSRKFNYFRLKLNSRIFTADSIA